jgi:sentrin-specific protease 7
MINNLLPPENRAKVHAFSCLFYSKLTEATKDEESFQLVSKWSKNVNLFDLDFILFPINLRNHWSLIVVARPALLVSQICGFYDVTAVDDD